MKFNSFLISPLLVLLLLEAAIVAEDMGTLDTVRFHGDTLMVGVSRPINVTVVNDFDIEAFVFGLQAYTLDSGFAIFDSARFIGRMENPLVLNERIVNYRDNDGISPDTQYVVGTGAGPVHENLYPGNDVIIQLYYTGLQVGRMMIDSSWFAPSNRFEILPVEGPLIDREYVPIVVTSEIPVVAYDPQPSLALAPSNTQIVAGNSAVIAISGTSIQDLDLTYEIIDLTDYDSRLRTPVNEPTLSTSGPIELNWNSTSSDVGIWEAKVRVCDTEGRCDTNTTIIQIVESGTYLSELNRHENTSFMYVTEMQAGDIDGDGAPELVATGTGHGYTSTGAAFEVGTGMNITTIFDLGPDFFNRDIEIGYVDSDEYVDIVMSGNLDGYIHRGFRTLFGGPSGPFEDSSHTMFGSSIYLISMGDFFGDQSVDVIAKGDDGYTFEGSSSGVFQYVDQFTTGGLITSMNSADLNSDGNLDIVFGTEVGIRIFLGDGQGDFTLTYEYFQDFGTFDLDITNTGSDFNNDTYYDFCLAAPTVEGTHSDLLVYFGNGDGSFSSSLVRSVLGHIYASRAADINGDGELDIVYANGSGKYLGILFGDGDGEFTNELRYFVDKWVPFRLECADFDLDGDIDIAMSSQAIYQGTSLYIFENDLDPSEMEQVPVAIDAVNNIELTLTSESGKELRKYKNSMASAALYQRDLDGNPTIDDYATLGVVERGEYIIEAMPQPGTNVGDPFTLEFDIAGQLYRFVQDYPMSQNGYQFAVFPAGYATVAPAPGSFIVVNPPTLSWYAAGSNFDLQLADNPDFDNPIVTTAVAANSYNIGEALALSDTATYYWRIKPAGESEYSPIYTFNLVAASGGDCCIGIRGNVNSDPAETINIADITFMVDYLFGIPQGTAPRCIEEANVNADPDEKLNITDLTYLVQYLFGVPAGAAPPNCP